MAAAARPFPHGGHEIVYITVAFRSADAVKMAVRRESVPITQIESKVYSIHQILRMPERIDISRDLARCFGIKLRGRFELATRDLFDNLRFPVQHVIQSFPANKRGEMAGEVVSKTPTQNQQNRHNLPPLPRRPKPAS